MKYYFVASVIASALTVLFAIKMFTGLAGNRTTGVVEIAIFVGVALLITSANGLLASLLTLTTDWQIAALISAIIHFVMLLLIGVVLAKELMR